jgi:outer membrane protein insertion porin family
MLLRNKYLYLFAFLYSLAAYCQTISSLEIEGNNIFSSSDYFEWSGLSAGMNYSEAIQDSAKDGIILNLSNRGYLDADFNEFKITFSTDSQRIFIHININENSPTIIKSINIENPDSIDIKNTVNQFGFLEGKILNKFEIEALINEALTFYENNGYPFAKIIISSIVLNYDSAAAGRNAEINIKIEKGEMRRIDSIEISGNTSTKDYVITRELRIIKGEIYSQREIEELPSRLNRLRYFDPVRVPQFYLNSENEGILVIDVKEQQTNNFDGIIGYIPGTGPDDTGYLTGLINISLRNLFGTGRVAAIKWQQLNRFSQELELRYLEPWVLDYPFNLSAGLFQRKQDTSYVQRKVEGAVEFLATQEISAAFILSSEAVIPTINETPRFTVYNSSSITTGVNLKIDSRDDPYSPTKGLFFLNSYSFSRKRISGPLEFLTPGLETNINLQRLSIALSGFYELFTRQVIALGINARELRGSFFEESDLFRLGGTSSLRGYREEQFFGNRIFWSNLEYRLLLTRRTYAFLFIDTGYYLRNEDLDRNIFRQEAFNFGYGLGLNLETGLGVLAVSFALAEGDAFSEGKIHFGIVNEF